ncbi:MAG TPA: CoA transferase [Acidimicrobiales bacterium]|nr:CoA transferase [Acidimicrobiales bacterium]
MTGVVGGARPLEGTRVIDLTDRSGAFAGRLLADLGADVVCVEPPGGAGLRHLAPFAGDEAGVERGLHHLFLSAGKRSVVLDRTTPGGTQRFDALVGAADVLIDTDPVDHASLVRLNPALVHVSVTPFGLSGARSGWRGTDLVCGAAAGLVWLNGAPADPPNHPGGNQAHKMAGLVAATATLIALTGRRLGSGAEAVHVDVSVQEAAAYATLQTANPAILEWQGKVPGRPGLTAVHRCADGGWITTSVRADRLDAFVEWCRELGIEVDDVDTLRDPFGGTVPLALLVRRVAAQYPRAEYLKRAWDMDLLGLPVHPLSELADNEHFAATGQFVDLDHPQTGGSLPMPLSPLAGVDGVWVGRAPQLGEHDQSVAADWAAPSAVTHVADPVRPAAPDGERAPTGGGWLTEALAGVRVLDFCWVLAGPLGTRILANFGAEVIRVEAGARAFPDDFPKGRRQAAYGAFHNLLNTQKRSITVDPRHPRGRQLLLDLVARCDVVTANYRPGALEEMGFGWRALTARNPRIVCVEMPGCGSRGPWRDRGTLGNMLAAAAGLNFATGFPGRAPRGLGVAYPDFTSPWLLAMAVMGALSRRDATGQAQHVDLRQLAATVSFVGTEWLHWATSGVEDPPANRDPNLAPHGVYPAAGEDEWVAIACDGDADWERLCEAIGAPELAVDGRFRTHADRRRNEDELDATVAAWTSTRDRWEAAELLQGFGVPAAPVQRLDDCLRRDPGLARHYQHVTRSGDPDVRIPVNGEPVRVAGVDRLLRPAPEVGADNDHVLGDVLGLSPAQIADLVSAGVVRDLSSAPLAGSG